jgi:hypothetical protein
MMKSSSADLLQRLAHFHGEEIVTHQPADGFAGEQVGGERLEQGVRQRMPVHDAARTSVFVEHRQRVQVGLAPEGFQHRCRRCIPGDRRLIVEQGAEVAALVVQRHGGAILFGHQVSRIPRRLFLWPAEQITLNQVDAHVGQHRKLFRQLDSLGNHPGPGGLGDLHDRADKLTLQGVLMDAVDEVPVDLHIIGSQLGPQTQA